MISKGPESGELVRQGSFPTKLQELLLKAALFEDERALEAWEAWRRDADLNDLEAESHRLIPLLHHNLRKLGVAAGELKHYKEVSKLYWLQSQLLVRKAGSLIDRLGSRGIQTLMLGGIPLAMQVYPSPALRQIGSVDLLVKREAVRETARVLEEEGFRTRGKMMEEEGWMRANSLTFQDASEMVVRVHWNPLRFGWGDEGVEEFWTQAEGFSIQGREGLMLCPSDMLLGLCADAAWGGTGPRWVADSFWLLRRRSDVLDWAQFAKRAETLRLSMALGKQLEYLSRWLRADALDEAIAQLGRNRRWRYEGLEYRMQFKKPYVFRRLLKFWFRHYRLFGEMPIWRRARMFAGFLRQSWGWFSRRGAEKEKNRSL